MAKKYEIWQYKILDQLKQGKDIELRKHIRKLIEEDRVKK